uniref:Uncharacterized protein n=1 Tax=Glossina austeni TaxID=7395 RepID=A0A1A9UJC4_GLOAU
MASFELVIDRLRRNDLYAIKHESIRIKYSHAQHDYLYILLLGPLLENFWNFPFFYFVLYKPAPLNPHDFFAISFKNEDKVSFIVDCIFSPSFGSSAVCLHIQTPQMPFLIEIHILEQEDWRISHTQYMSQMVVHITPNCRSVY